jgi:NAD+ kinase
MLAYRARARASIPESPHRDMKRKFRTVGLFGKYQDQSVAGHIQRLAEFLRGRGVAVVIEAATAALLGGGGAPAPSRPLETIGPEIDLAIVVGGDGSMLRAARVLAAHRVPLVGINLGRLGFLTDLQESDMFEALGRILDGHYRSEERLLLAAEVVGSGGEVVHTARAFNEVVVSKGELARLIEFETYLDGDFVNSTRGDGLIIASPTGSTAYALSAGGPILHPNLPAMALVPICPHTLSYRPIVVSSEAVIEVVPILTAGSHVHVTFDGQETRTLGEGERVRVRRAPEPVELVHPAGRNHFEVLRLKLRWGEKF